MGQPFSNPVVGGGGALVVPLIRSPNFSLAGETGWAIMANGDAYFYNITAEGSISANTVVVSGSGEGVFIYSGTPASGNLVGSWTSASGTDAYGNAYAAGLTVGGSGYPQIAMVPIASDAAEIQFPIASVSLSSLPNIAGGVSAGTPSLGIAGPAIATSGDEDWCQILLWGNNGAGTPSRIEFRTVSTTGSATVAGTLNSSGWTFNTAVSVTDGITVNYMTSPNGNPVFGWSEWSGSPSGPGADYGSPPSGSGSAVASAFDGSALAYIEAQASSYNDTVAAVSDHESRLSYLYAVLQDSGIIAGG